MFSKSHTEILGVLLVGGKGTRVKSLTSGMNKHLLEIQGKSLAELGINYLLALGINNIAVVMHPEDERIFEKIFAPYKKFCNYYKHIFQERPTGTGHALELATVNSPFSQALMLFADNIFSNLQKVTEISCKQARAKLYVTPTKTPQNFSVVKCDLNGFVQKIEYKSPNPMSNLAATGLMQFNVEALSQLICINARTKGTKDIMNTVTEMVTKKSVTCNKVIGKWIDATVDEEAFAKANELTLKYSMSI